MRDGYQLRSWESVPGLLNKLLYADEIAVWKFYLLGVSKRLEPTMYL